MTDLAALRRANAQRWASAKLTRNFSSIAKRLVAPDVQSRYQAVSARTGVPWPVIAVIHERECSQDWTRSLAQGDPWDRVSVHVPSGRGPFQSWEDAAIDALENCAPYAGRNRDWSIGALLTVLEEYNGLGYAARGVASPYLWAGTDQYRSGKYVRDGVYDPNVIDSQPGCAGLLMTMRELDSSIAFQGAPIKPTPPQAPATTASKGLAPRPSIKNPARGSIGAWVACLLRALFKSKGK
jgi:lysozyme family protein